MASTTGIQVSKPPTDLRSLRNRRERAEDWITYASWTAIGTAVFVGILYVTVWLGDLSGGVEIVSVFSTLIAQGLFGYKLRLSRSQFAAWGLMAAYLAGIAVTFVNGTIWSGILVKAAIAYVYIRGFLATLDYEELTTQIHQLANEQSSTDAI